MSHPYRNRTRAVRGAARAHLRQLRAERLARRGHAEPDAAGQAETGSAEADDHGGLSVSGAVASVAGMAARPTPPDDGLGAGSLGAGSDAAEVQQAPHPLADTGAAEGAGAAPQPARAEHDGAPPLPAAQLDPDVEHSGAEAVGAPSGSAADPGNGVDPGNAANPGNTANPGNAADPRNSDDPGNAEELAPASDPEPADAASRPGDTAQPDAFDEGAASVQRSDLLDLPGAGPGLVWMLSQCGVHSMADLSAADAGVLRERLGLVGQILDLDGWIAFATDATGGRAGDGPSAGSH